MSVVWIVWGYILYVQTLRGVAGAQLEYMIDLNINIISTQAKEDAFVSRLKLEYKINLIESIHGGSIRMLHVSVSEAHVDDIETLPEINIVEENTKANITGCIPSCYKIAVPETWGLDRIDQRDKLSSQDPENKLATFSQGTHRGAGVVAYVVDTGIDINHTAFGNRAFWGHTVPGMGDDIDGHGHGTHVAGTIGSEHHGVASEVILMAVKVFNDNGDESPWSVIISGLKWVLDHHNSMKSGGNKPKSVANLSLSGEVFACMDKWVRELISAGINVVVAAGNNNIDACQRSPARVQEAITVGASDVTDSTTWFSNWGCCVNVYAPGDQIKSTLPVKHGSMGFKRGTSMATPHVSGVIALKLSKDIDIKTPGQMSDWIIESSTMNKLTFYNDNHATSPNRLLFVDCERSDAVPILPYH